MPESNTRIFRRTGPYAFLFAALLLGALGIAMALAPAAAREALLRNGAWRMAAPIEARTSFADDAPTDAMSPGSAPLEHAAIFLAGVIVSGVALFCIAGVLGQLRAASSLRAVRRHAEHLQELGAALDPTNDITALGEIFNDLLATQCAAESDWLAGSIRTAHMENLNIVFAARSRAVQDKIHQLQLQALLEGGPTPAIIRPEPARPNYGAMAEAVTPPAPAPRAVEAPRPMAARAPEPVAQPVAHAPAEAPTSQGKHHKKKDRGRHGAPPQPQAVQAPQATPQPTAQAAPVAPVERPVAAVPSGISEARPMSATRPPTPAPAPRKLEDWEIEQKYQRSSDEISYFDSGIVSPPRPRRVQAPVDGAAPASAALDAADVVPGVDESEAEAERRRSQLDLF